MWIYITVLYNLSPIFNYRAWDIKIVSFDSWYLNKILYNYIIFLKLLGKENAIYEAFVLIVCKWAVGSEQKVLLKSGLYMPIV